MILPWPLDSKLVQPFQGSLRRHQLQRGRILFDEERVSHSGKRQHLLQPASPDLQGRGHPRNRTLDGRVRQADPRQGPDLQKRFASL